MLLETCILPGYFSTLAPWTFHLGAFQIAAYLADNELIYKEWGVRAACFSSPLPITMQVQNASSLDGGHQLGLSANVTWVSPSLPGEPPNILRTEFAACVPSNVDLASICCSAVNGQFVTRELANKTSVDDAEARSIYEAKYPGQNVSVPTSLRQGNLINATGAGLEGAINWCSMPYNPLSDTDLVGVGMSSGGALLGKVPESILDWIKCFENNTSVEERGLNEAVYVCSAVDVQTGGRIEGYNMTYATESMRGANGGGRGEPSRWIGLLGVTVIAGLWTVCV